MAHLASIFWYKENEIEILLSIENECKIKIFPRYYFDRSVSLDLERFCWEQYLIEEFHEIEDKMFTIHSEKDLTVNSKFLEILLSDHNFSELPDPEIETLNMLNRIDTPFEE